MLTSGRLNFCQLFRAAILIEFMRNTSQDYNRFAADTTN